MATKYSDSQKKINDLILGVFGYNQNGKDLTLARSPGVVYTNTGTRPKLVLISGQDSRSNDSQVIGNSIEISVNGIVYNKGGQGVTNAFAIVNPGQTYECNLEAAYDVIGSWIEYD